MLWDKLRPMEFDSRKTDQKMEIYKIQLITTMQPSISICKTDINERIHREPMNKAINSTKQMVSCERKKPSCVAFSTAYQSIIHLQKIYAPTSHTSKHRLCKVPHGIVWFDQYQERTTTISKNIREIRRLERDQPHSPPPPQIRCTPSHEYETPSPAIQFLAELGLPFHSFTTPNSFSLSPFLHIVLLYRLQSMQLTHNPLAFSEPATTSLDHPTQSKCSLLRMK